MKTEIGEYIVGAYLKIVEQYDFVEYNVRAPGGGLKGLNELDVLGLRFADQTAVLCEVTTHIRGVLYKNNAATVQRIKKKHDVQKRYAEEHLITFPNRIYQLWSPVVPQGYLTTELAKLSSLELVINRTYAERIDELRARARVLTHDVGNPFFRALQILEHLRRG